MDHCILMKLLKMHGTFEGKTNIALRRLVKAGEYHMPSEDRKTLIKEDGSFQPNPPQFE